MKLKRVVYMQKRISSLSQPLPGTWIRYTSLKSLPFFHEVLISSQISFQKLLPAVSKAPHFPSMRITTVCEAKLA